MELGKTFVIPFNIFMDAKYRHVKVVGNETTFQTSTTSLGKSIKKSNILSIEKEQRVLAQMMCQPTSPCNLNLKFGYFYMQHLFISDALLNSLIYSNASLKSKQWKNK
jgi:hypothetical protein